jgi:hypothetical protein
MSIRTVVRYVWAAPASAVGLLLAGVACASGATARIADGVVEVAVADAGAAPDGTGFSLGWVAITFGHVVLGRSHAVLAKYRAHEHEHVRQYERWGVLFFFLYVGSSAALWLRGARPYWDNRFERQARAAQDRFTSTGSIS